MPKILENIREILLQEAKRQVFENGYSSLTIRSVACACGIGVGTVYNYFESKDALVAGFMLEDWGTCMTAINNKSEISSEVEPVLRCIYDELKLFADKYDSLFNDESARQSFAGSYQSKRELLRNQIAAPLLKFCEKQKKVSAQYLAEFTAESMLMWTLSNGTYEDVSGVLLQLFS